MSRRKRKTHEVKTAAPDVGFKRLHPTETGSKQELRKGPDLPPSGASDGIESKYTRCKHCGFNLIDKNETSKGDEWGGNIATTESTTNHPVDSTVKGGCPFCGAGEYESRPTED